MQETSFPISKDSRYALVMAVAKRARQLMREAQDKGVNPWEVCLLKTVTYKPIKLAEEELSQGLVGYRLKENIPVKAKEKDSPEAVEKPAEEPPTADSKEESPDAEG